jgi:hypothetical protein
MWYSVFVEFIYLAIHRYVSRVVVELYSVKLS